MEGVTFRALDDNGVAIEPQVEEIVDVPTVVEDVPTVVEDVPTVVEDVPTVVEDVPTVVEDTIDDNKILSYFKERHNKEYQSLDDVFKQNEQTAIPEEVAKYLDYKKETGRNFNDFQNLQKDWNGVADSEVLREYYKTTKPHLDDSEVSYLLEENFSYDESLDDDRDVKKKQIAIKEELYKARNHFESMKEKFKAPLESSDASLPEDYKAAYSFYNEYKKESETEQQLTDQRSRVFSDKTDSLFNQEFKGFEFNLGDKKSVFEVKDTESVKKSQSDLSNFFSRHLDDKGFLKDPQLYHKEMYAATNADKIAKHFYEQGLSDATKGLVKDTKNIDMDVRTNAQVDSKGPKFRILEPENDFKMKIKKR
jgi:hypothetical protein